jgi:hypothetical protein
MAPAAVHLGQARSYGGSAKQFLIRLMPAIPNERNLCLDSLFRDEIYSLRDLEDDRLLDESPKTLAKFQHGLRVEKYI